MKQSIYKTYDDLPLFLNATMVAQVLGISAASSYELMHEKGFPVCLMITMLPKRRSEKHCKH